MAKYILTDYVNKRVTDVKDSMPENGLPYVEVSNDNVALYWWHDIDNNVLAEYRPYDIGEVRVMRDAKLTECDWMVAEDSPYQASEQSSNLTAIKTYRQALRDFPDESVTYNENNINWPTLTLS